MKKLQVIIAAYLLLLPYAMQAMDAAEAEGQKLYDAAFRDNIDDVRAAIAAGANVNWQNKFGYTPLYLATNYNNLDAIQALITVGANVNLANKEGETPLYKAAKNNNVDILETLLGADGIDYNMVAATRDLLLTNNIQNDCTDRIQEWLDGFGSGLK